jgi:hypothetical protein
MVDKAPKKNTSNDTKTILFISLLLYFLWSFVYMVIIFRQFSFLQILATLFSFSMIFVCLNYIFNKQLFYGKINITYKNIFISVIVFALIALSASSVHEVNFVNRSDYWNLFYPTYPLIEIGHNLGIHLDSVFHVAIIRNILNFGFPSLGQHDTPFLFYHVLSHYMDAAILFCTGIDPLDSYGLFFFMKIWLFVSSLLVFIFGFLKKKHSYITLPLLVMIIYPIVLSTWHGIGSHGIWLITIIMLLSANDLYKIINKEIITTGSFFKLFFIIVIFSMGKISTGFMSAIFLGFYVFCRNFQNWKTYLLGIAWIVFFILFNYFYSGGIPQDGVVFFDIDSLLLLSKDGIYSAYSKLRAPNMFNSIFIILLLSIIPLIVTRKKSELSFCISTFFSLVILILLFTITKNFSSADKFYFTYGLYSIIILYYIIWLYDFILSEWGSSKLKKLMLLGIIFVNISATYFFEKSSFNVFNLGLNSIEKHLRNINRYPFRRINKLVDKNKEVSIKKIVISGNVFFKPESILPPAGLDIANFKHSLHVFLTERQITAKDILLYVPNEIFINQLLPFRGKTGRHCSLGFLMYSVTGIPLIYGNGQVGSKYKYGLSSYDERSLRRDLSQFDTQEACRLGKNILVVKDFITPTFEMINCNDKCKPIKMNH